MKHICIGILAHVDSGKTTLSEGLLYASGALRKLGRVDHGDAFLDTDALERERGITIFAKQAMLTAGETEITLLDTPGHVDFSAEMERTLSVLDYAVLVISGSDGVQSHTRTLWRLLERYSVPTFLFINKMDLAGADKASLMAQLTKTLSAGCIDFSLPTSERDEALALCDETALEQVLERGAVDERCIADMIEQRAAFPCFFGSALKLQGVEALLSALDEFTLAPDYPDAFGARVFKISRDAQGARLTWLKVTGGVLRVKAPLSYEAQGRAYSEKADQLRLYSGVKFRTLEKADAGSVVAVTGLSHSHVGLGLGAEAEASAPLLQPVLTYRLILPDGADAHSALTKLRELEEEDPMLRIVWDEHSGQIHVQLMGKIQLEILRRLISDRFGLAVSFGEGSIVYRETIAAPVLGMGHFEPLRHYAEVQLLIEPLPRGAGVQLASTVPTDVLDLNWQRLIFTHLLEREHTGVLTGSPLTDVKFTLVAGRAHLKHTEGGDFRQATYRAVRQGLMQAKSVLLEPWYEFCLTMPTEQIGRAITDIRAMGGEFDAPEAAGALSTVKGLVPASEIKDYADTLAAYTQGLGRMQLTLHGYAPCHNTDAVVAETGYDPEADLANTPDSVFCAHGAGFTVKWNQVKDYMHLESGLKEEKAPEIITRNVRLDDKELEKIMEREFGPIRRPVYGVSNRPAADDVAIRTPRQKYIIVDGYNVIFAWEDLAAQAKDDLDAARRQLCDRLSSYAGFTKCRLVVVFDGYKQKGNPGEKSQFHNIQVVYTKEGQTADAYIEALAHEIGRDYAVRVASSDGLVQLSSFGSGVLRMSARELHEEVEAARAEMRKHYRK